MPVALKPSELGRRVKKMDGFQDLNYVIQRSPLALSPSSETTGTLPLLTENPEEGRQTGKHDPHPH